MRASRGQHKGSMHSASPPVALSIAGSDPSGGAGVQADLKTFAAHLCYGAAAITALTVQNTRGVSGVHACPPAIVAGQVRAVVDDLPVRAIKTGMLVDGATVRAVVAALVGVDAPVVVDPVMISKSGHALLDDDAIDAVRTLLLPRAALVTPNLPECARLLGWTIDAVAKDPEAAGSALVHGGGARAALVKGGHAHGDVVDDVLVVAVDAGPDRVLHVKNARVATRHTHGTGCTLSSAIAARLAHGDDLVEAVCAAVAYVHTAIVRAPGLGGGHGPLEHLHPFLPAPPERA